MVTQILEQGWKMRSLLEKDYCPASVPGSVYYDYLANGKMEDPFYRANEEKALNLMKQDFEYVVKFDADKKVFASDRVLLHFDGIDTLGEITLNSVFLGKTNNMHRIWEFDVRHVLKEADNELQVVLRSPVNYIYDSYEKDPLSVDCSDAMRGCSRLRKAHCMFGWDWGPRLPDAGIFRTVKLLGILQTRLDSVYISQVHEAGKVTLKLKVDVDNPELPVSYRVTLIEPDGKKQIYENSPEHIVVEKPQLWWPNGYGSQPLYGIDVELLSNGVCVDNWNRRIGLRTVTVAREKDQWGESFCHEVNGVRIFAMGADYIPEDNVLPRVIPERTYHLLKQARDAHFNCVRVWGGGYYPDDFFYDACDELGLLIWQDFMFACCSYELTEEFENNITAEFIDNVKRIRHHASLGLWCGNNEMELFVESDVKFWCPKPTMFSDYFKMYEYIIPKVLKEHDPETFYWPASPSSGGGMDYPNDESRGDVHYWDVWHGGKPITEFRKFYFRYLSEFGFQSFPGIRTVETFTRPEDRNIFTYVMEKHQRNKSANGKIMDYMGQTYLYPKDFETLLYASQLLQAEAMRYGVEHFRRNRGRCMGTLIWQLNDCWPTASWAMIDYKGRWKAVQYYAKRFYAPLLLSCDEESLLTQNTNVNAEPFNLKKSIRLCVSNESMDTKEVEVMWKLCNPDGSCIKKDSRIVTIGALDCLWFDREDMTEAKTWENYVYYEMKADGERVSAGSVLFCPPKHFAFENPHLTVWDNGDDTITVSADAFAKSVEILNADDTMLLDDNYFDMQPGNRIIRVISGKVEGLKVRSVYDIPL